MMKPGAWGTLIWALLGVAAVVVAARATYTADLSAFLPRSPSATQRLLVEQLRSGPAARLILVAIDGGAPQTRALLSAGLARRLRADPNFVAVNNGDAASLDRDREFLVRNRYLLSAAVTPQRFSVTGLHAAIEDSVGTLASRKGCCSSRCSRKTRPARRSRFWTRLPRIAHPARATGCGRPRMDAARSSWCRRAPRAPIPTARKRRAERYGARLTTRRMASTQPSAAAYACA